MSGHIRLSFYVICFSCVLTLCKEDSLREENIAVYRKPNYFTCNTNIRRLLNFSKAVYYIAMSYFDYYVLFVFIDFLGIQLSIRCVSTCNKLSELFR